MENDKPIKEEIKKTKKKAPRCKCKLEDGNKCKKKLTLVDLYITCKCGKSFCPSHRPADKHECKITDIIAKKNKAIQLNIVLGGGSFKQVEVI